MSTNRRGPIILTYLLNKIYLFEDLKKDNKISYLYKICVQFMLTAIHVDIIVVFITKLLTEVNPVYILYQSIIINMLISNTCPSIDFISFLNHE